MKLDLNSLLENKKIVAILSVLVAVIMWFSVALGATSYSDIIKDVPVQLDAANSTAGKLDLKPLISGNSPMLVSVTVTGRPSVIGNLTADDIYVTASIAHIVVAGTHDITFTATDINNKGFEIVSIAPSITKVEFDTWVSNDLEVSYKLNGLTIPEDYFRDEVILNIETVRLTGPESLVDKDKVASCVVQLNFDKPQTATINEMVPIQFLDAEGNVINDDLNPNFVRLNESGGAEMELPGQVQVTIPILKRKTLPVVLTFTNIPEGFDTESIVYTLSEEIIDLAGPENTIDNMEAFPLGYIDMRYLEPGYNEEMPVILPSGFKNLHDIETITVDFTLNGYETRDFTLANIAIVNAPKDHTITVDTRQIRATIAGPTSVLRTLAAEDFIAEIDMSHEDLVIGQTTVPVKIRALERDNVWAYDSYTAVITVREN